MLNAVLATALVVAASATATPAPPTPLAIGSVRDHTGRALVGALVRVRDAAGNVVGEDRSDDRGTFAVLETATAASIEVTCAHCQTTRVPATDASYAIVVRRYDALESDVPSPRDLVALPYPRIADTLGLIPYVLLTNGGGVSDRALGPGLVEDFGMPIVDRAAGTSGLANFPDRYVRSISFSRAEEAYRYGEYAQGGVFDLDRLPDDASYASFDTGQNSSLTLQPKIGRFFPSAGVSDDANLIVRRADLDYVTPFAGGVLRTGVTGEGALQKRFSLQTYRREYGSRVSYATASRRYRTFADFSATDLEYALPVAGYRSSYINADFRVEKPGPVALTFGVRLARANSVYLAGRFGYGASTNDADLYAKAHVGNDRNRLDVGFAGFATRGGSQAAPSLSGRFALGSRGIYGRASYAESPETSTRLLTTSGTYPVYHSDITQVALGYDAGARVRAEAIAYGATMHRPELYEGAGIGATLVWQVAPLIALRAWTLRVTPFDARPYGFSPYTDTSRQVVWATYENAAGLRFDAIVHRFATTSPFGQTPTARLDYDTLLPLVRDVSISAGSTYDALGRHYAFGLRAKH